MSIARYNQSSVSSKIRVINQANNIDKSISFAFIKYRWNKIKKIYKLAIKIFSFNVWLVNVIMDRIGYPIQFVRETEYYAVR